MANNIGKITQIIGAVLDIKFAEATCLRSTMLSKFLPEMEKNW